MMAKLAASYATALKPAAGWTADQVGWWEIGVADAASAIACAIRGAALTQPEPTAQQATASDDLAAVYLAGRYDGRKEAQQAAGEAEAVGRARKLYEAVEAGQFDALDAAADKWVEEAGVQRMSNAIASVFEKYASQEIMDRFREKITALIHLAFVEGAGQGVIQSAPLYATPQPTETRSGCCDWPMDDDGKHCSRCGKAQPTETQRIVAWLRAEADKNVEAAARCRSGNAGETLRRLADRRRIDANLIERGEHLAGEGDKA